MTHHPANWQKCLKWSVQRRFISKFTHSTKTTKILCSGGVVVLSTKFRISTESGGGQLSTVNCKKIYLRVLYIKLSWHNLLLLGKVILMNQLDATMIY